MTNKKRSLRKTKKNNKLGKYVLLFIIFLFFVFFVTDNIPISNFGNQYSQDEAGLRKTVEKQYKIAANGDEKGLREIYENYLSSSNKISITEDKYVSDALSIDQSEGIQASRFDINSITIDGTEGYVDRTVYLCDDTACTNIKYTSRTFRKYVYENQRWLMTGESFACPRKQMHDMEPEFSRAISLISQRLPSDSNFQAIKNCLSVRYATSNEEMKGAEGLFKFVPGQSLLQLDIFVSPQYKVKDDLLTAFILAHEGEHAANYALELFTGEPYDCFVNEGIAFNAQYYLFSQLNQEEQNSLSARFYSNPSQELRNLFSTYDYIQRYSGSDFVVKATNYVKSDPYYQSQCAGR